MDVPKLARQQTYVEGRSDGNFGKNSDMAMEIGKMETDLCAAIKRLIEITSGEFQSSLQEQYSRIIGNERYSDYHGYQVGESYPNPSTLSPQNSFFSEVGSESDIEGLGVSIEQDLDSVVVPSSVERSRYPEKSPNVIDLMSFLNETSHLVSSSMDNIPHILPPHSPSSKQVASPSRSLGIRGTKVGRSEGNSSPKHAIEKRNYENGDVASFGGNGTFSEDASHHSKFISPMASSCDFPPACVYSNNGIFSVISLDARGIELAPIVSIMLLIGNEPVPEGYEKISHTVGGRKADLNAGAGFPYLYLCIQRDPNWPRNCIVGVTVVFPDRGECFPPGYTPLRRKGKVADLNYGMNAAERIYLGYKYGAGNPLSELAVYQPRKDEKLPPGLYPIKESPDGYDADVNVGPFQSVTIYLACRYHLLNMKGLRSHEDSVLPSGWSSCSTNFLDPINEFFSGGASPPVLHDHLSSGQPKKKGHRRNNERWAFTTNWRAGSASSRSGNLTMNTASTAGPLPLKNFRGPKDIRTISDGSSMEMALPRGAAVLSVAGRHHGRQLIMAKQEAFKRSNGVVKGEGDHTPAPSPSIEAKTPDSFQSLSNNMPLAQPYIPRRASRNFSSNYVGLSNHYAVLKGATTNHRESLSSSNNTSPATRALEQGSPTRSRLGATCQSSGFHSVGRSTEKDSLYRSKATMHSVPNLPSLLMKNTVASQNGSDDGQKPSPPIISVFNSLLKRVNVATMAGYSVSANCRDLMSLLLCSLYVREDGVSRKALDQLTYLLTTNFFEHDLMRPMSTLHKPSFETIMESLTATRLYGHESQRTLLDFTIESVCDLILQARTKEYIPAMNFLTAVVKQLYGHRIISLSSLKRIFGAFVFYSSYCASEESYLGKIRYPSFENADEPIKSFAFNPDTPAYEVFSDLVRSLLIEAEYECTVADTDGMPTSLQLKFSNQESNVIPENQNDGSTSQYVPSKQHSTMSLIQEGDCESSTIVNEEEDREGSNADLPKIFVRDLVWDIAEGVVRMVELARTTEMAIMCTRRLGTNATGNDIGDDDFWREAMILGHRAYPSTKQSCIGKQGLFVVLLALCRTAAYPLRRNVNGNVSRRDIGLRVLAFDLIRQILQGVGGNLYRDGIFGYQVRRLVVGVIISTCTDILVDERMFQLMMDIISVLWRNFRRHCKVELAVLMDNLILKLLKSIGGPSPVSDICRIQILDKLMLWFDIPDNLVELFLNYDMDRRYVQGRKIFDDLLSAICTVAEGGPHDISLPVTPPTSGFPAHNTPASKEALRLRALRAVVQMVKCLMDAAGHGHLLMRDSKTREISYGLLGGWEEDDEDVVDDGTEEKPIDERARKLLHMSRHNRRKGVDYGVVSPLAGSSVSESVLDSPGSPPKLSLNESGGTLTSSPWKKGADMKKGQRLATSFKYRRELRKRAEECIKQALEMYRRKGLKKAVRYLIASNFISDSPRDIANFLRIYQDDLDPASIGDFLSEPDTEGSDYFRLIRLQYIRAVNFHSMTLEEALRHLLTNSGFRLPGESQKIDRLLTVFAECYYQDNAELCPFSSSISTFVVSFAIIMLNTDLHKANMDSRKKKRMSKSDFVKNLRGVNDSVEITSKYLEDIYDSIEANPIAMLLPDSLNIAYHQRRGSTNQNPLTYADVSDMFLADLNKGCTQGAELLRALSLFGNRFLVVGLDTSLSLELVKQMFEASWFHFLGAVDAVLERPDVDAESIIICLEIVKYALCTSIFLNVTAKREVFADRLTKISHRMGQNGMSKIFPKDRPCSLSNTLVRPINPLIPEDAETIIATVHAHIRMLEQNVQDTYDKEELESVARRLKNAQILDTSRRIIREGNLTKICRSGRKVLYRFFLFSDKLLYAQQSYLSGNWEVHEELQLLMLRVEDLMDRKDCKFQIYHPRKSFVVIAENSEEKLLWKKELDRAIENVKRERRRALLIFSPETSMTVGCTSSSRRKSPSFEMKNTRKSPASKKPSDSLRVLVPGKLETRSKSGISRFHVSEGEDDGSIMCLPSMKSASFLTPTLSSASSAAGSSGIRPSYKKSPSYRSMSAFTSKFSTRYMSRSPEKQDKKETAEESCNLSLSST